MISRPKNDPFDPATQAILDLAGDYDIDPSHSRIGFSARHAMVTTVRGHFAAFEGAAHIDTVRPAASWVNVAIDASSIGTGSADRDGHLRSADFLDAAAHPNLTFTSTAVSTAADGTWEIVGDLSIRGITAPVSIDFEHLGSSRDPYGNLRVGFEGSTTINRKDWGLTWNAALETGGLLVSERVKLSFDISAIQKPPN